MRDLLFLCHRIPYPPDKGDKIRSYNILRHLSSRFAVHLGCFVDDAADQRYSAPLREICAEVLCVPLPKTRKAQLGLQGIVLGKSMSENIYRSRRMQDWIRNVLISYEIKNIFVFCSAMSPYVREHRFGRRVAIDMVDVDSEKWGAYARSAWWPLSAVYRFEQRHVQALEKSAVATCDCALFVSKAEANAFLRFAPELSGRVGYLENGVELDRFNPALVFASPFAAGSSPIVFTGVMNYPPNIEAVVWFAREVFPAVRRARVDAEFWIVGANPVASVRALSRRKGIRVTGAVADVRPYLARAACCVAPMRIARGVQNKVLEGMAMARPVILTPAALEGLNAIPGEEVLVAGNAGEFVRHVLDVLSGHGKKLAHAGRARVERDHCWSTNLTRLDPIFDAPSPSAFGHTYRASSRV